MDSVKIHNNRINTQYSELVGLPFEHFQKNRSKYISNLSLRMPNMNKNSLIVLKGGLETPRYDTDVSHYHFYQESNFFYLTGVREPGLYATIDIRDSTLTLFYDQPPEDNKIWMNVLTASDVATKYGVNVEAKEGLNAFLQSRNMDLIYILEGQNEYSKKNN